MSTKIKIQIKNRWTGSVLFEYEKEDNTVKDTLIEAVKNHADLGGAYLGGANLRGTDLGDANLSGADLRGANLRGANLGGTNLRGANLGGANLGDAYLFGACLFGACLFGANLGDANLSGANLGDANLGGANLRGTDLRGANLGDAYLRGANLGDAKNIPFIPLACPSDGAFIGWKKVKEKLIMLEIPEDAKRCSAIGRKCRCDKAKVLGITDLDGSNPIESIVNESYTPCVTYTVGEMVYPDSFDENRWKECSNGIHFFINRQEAVEY